MLFFLRSFIRFHQKLSCIRDNKCLSINIHQRQHQHQRVTSNDRFIKESVFQFKKSASKDGLKIIKRKMIVVIFYFWKWRKIHLLSKCCIWTCITYLLLISAGSVAQSQKNNDEQVSIESYFEEQHLKPSHYYDNRTILQEKAKFNQRKILLCATFLDSSNQLARKNAMKNVAATASSCDWVFIIYKGVKCNKDGKYKSSSISCHVSTIRDVYSYIFQQAQVIPKALLYFDLLPFITNYQYILLVDEDVSIESFNFKLYEHILRCSFYPLPPPMISQGLISDEFIPFPFFKPTTWKEKPFLSTETNLIEQQIPIMNSLFFGWFVENIIYPSIPMILENGNTWVTISYH